jgi:RimJ/RimL family protein N-acetyltransferase
MHVPWQQEAAAALRADPAAKVAHAPVMVIRDPAGRLIGDVGLDPQPGFLALGYALDPAHHGRGIGRAAVGAVIAWAAGRMGTDFRGVSSIKLAARDCGRWSCRLPE